MTKGRFKKLLIKAYKHDRLYGRADMGKDYGDLILKSHWDEFQKTGRDFVSRHESVFGGAVWITEKGIIEV
jgi:hypothetical protein